MKTKIKEYNLYPTPQNISYTNGEVAISPSINLIIGEKIDETTKSKIKKILVNNKLKYKLSNDRDENKTNIVLQISSDVKNELFKKIDAYSMNISKDSIEIIGKDTNAIYYGLTTLEHIFEQSEEQTLRNLVIEDYSDTKIRGVIEGFYGIPWGNKNREILMRFGAKFKSNAFVFAPKDDPYHREEWSKLYPEKELLEIKKLAQLGNELKNNYVWTIAPFHPDSNPINQETEKEGIKKLLIKFEQLYHVGVRQFGVLGDDVGALPKKTVVNVMKAVSKWGNEKEIQGDFLFVPESYVIDDWGFDAEELNFYDENFPEDVQIMFTGQQVISGIDQDAVYQFKNKETDKPRRDPLFWLNWPVNDIDRDEIRRLFMGEGELMTPNVKNLSGVLTNPMEEANASLLAIFATLDYSWNLSKFNSNKSWVDSFKYIEPNTPESLYEICKHTADMGVKEIGELRESENFVDVINKFKKAVNTNTSEITEVSQELIRLYSNIEKAVNDFLINGHNNLLKQEMKPYIVGLREKSQAAIKLLNALIIRENEGSEMDVSNDIALAEDLLKMSRSHIIKTTTAEFPTKELRAETGTLRINDNIKFIYDLLN